MIKQKKASEIYNQQNKIFHKFFNAIGMPYRDNKEMWLDIFSQILNKKVNGLSELTLKERDKILKYFQKKYKKIRIPNPAIPKKLWSWKKGDKELTFKMVEEDEPELKLARQLMAELGYEALEGRQLIKRMFGVDDIRFLRFEDRSRLINFLMYRLNKKDGVKYYAEI